MNLDNNNYLNQINEILNEKNNLEIQSTEDKNKIIILKGELNDLKKDYNNISVEKNILNDKYNLINEDNYNLKKRIKI